jgi:hypothetical protein
MSDETEADIVLQLDTLATYAERADHWAGDKRLMGAAGVADTLYGAIDRIEELETRLAKAAEALGVIDALDPEGRIDGYSQLALRGLVLRMGEHARAAIAELKGQDDDQR